ncbi:MAG: nucleotidyltransferase [Gemmatimonadaceae bacterium]
MSFATILQGLRAADVKFVVVGGLAATAHGSRRVTDDVDICYDTAKPNLIQLAELLTKWKAYPRGIETGLPFFMDERQFRTTPLMTLTTSEGFLDVLNAVKGVGAHAKCRERSKSIEAFDIRFRVLDLNALIDAKRAAGRPKDIDQLPELEALRALSKT